MFTPRWRLYTGIMPILSRCLLLGHDDGPRPGHRSPPPVRLARGRPRSDGGRRVPRGVRLRAPRRAGVGPVPGDFHRQRNGARGVSRAPGVSPGFYPPRCGQRRSGGRLAAKHTQPRKRASRGIDRRGGTNGRVRPSHDRWHSAGERYRRLLLRSPGRIRDAPLDAIPDGFPIPPRPGSLSSLLHDHEVLQNLQRRWNPTLPSPLVAILSKDRTTRRYLFPLVAPWKLSTGGGCGFLSSTLCQCV